MGANSSNASASTSPSLHNSASAPTTSSHNSAHHNDQNDRYIHQVSLNSHPIKDYPNYHLVITTDRLWNGITLPCNSRLLLWLLGKIPRLLSGQRRAIPQVHPSRSLLRAMYLLSGLQTPTVESDVLGLSTACRKLIFHLAPLFSGRPHLTQLRHSNNSSQTKK